MSQTEEKLGTKPLGSLMLSMGIPTLVAQMINLLYNIVDRIYIGQGVGREALTGLGLALPAITIVSAFSALAGAGGAPLAAIALGQGNKEKAERITGNVFAMLRKVFLLVPFALIFPLVTGNVYSIYFAECMADVISAVTCGTLFVLKIRKILERGAKQ